MTWDTFVLLHSSVCHFPQKIQELSDFCLSLHLSNFQVFIFLTCSLSFLSFHHLHNFLCLISSSWSTFFNLHLNCKFLQALELTLQGERMLDP